MDKIVPTVFVFVIVFKKHDFEFSKSDNRWKKIFTVEFDTGENGSYIVVSDVAEF